MGKVQLVVELGSSNTVIYRMGNGIVLREPSLIAIKQNTKQVFEVGIKAKKLLGKTDENITVFSPIKNGVIVNEQACIMMFEKFLEKVLDFMLPKKVDVLFCVQNGLTKEELLVFKNVAYACKIENVDFINVCKASALCCGYNKNNPNATISLNIGGGTMNMAVISRGEVIDGYSIGFGGIDMDYKVKEYVANLYNHDISLSTAEKLKMDCGSLYKQDTTNMEVSGIDMVSRKPQTEIVLATDILNAVDSYFVNIVKSVEQLLHLCTPDVIEDISENGIIASGGVANIVGFEDYFTRKLNLKVFIPEQPENAVILGGALYLTENNKK